MDTYGEYSFKVRTSECGPGGRASLPAICGLLQEAAALNAGELAFSRSDFEAAGENISWVLSRLRVKIPDYPVWGESVKVLTFPRGGRRITAWRDFIVTGEGGRAIAVATSEWMLIDLGSRKILPVPEKVFAAANTVREPVLGLEPYTPRLRFPRAADGDVSRPGPLVFRAGSSHMDMNGHVNNVHYIEWLLEACPQRSVGDFEIVFRSETFAGESVCVEAFEDVSTGRMYHRVASPSGKDHVVAVTSS